MKYIAGIVLYNPDLGRLKENIESICKQVDKVILIDNGSDNIREIEDLIKEYLNCILLKNGENMGIAYALNQILKYAYENDVQRKNKYSVSELKHRAMREAFEKEEEAVPVFQSEEVVPYVPAFAREIEQQSEDASPGALRGTAMHRIMECYQFSSGVSAKEQVAGMLEKEQITPEMHGLIRIPQVEYFVNADIGKRMGAAEKDGKLYREKPFVMGFTDEQLDEFGFAENTEQAEKVKSMGRVGNIGETEYTGKELTLIQGIIDVFWIEKDGIVLLDYKTDRVDTEKELSERYAAQLKLYEEALNRVYENEKDAAGNPLKVKEKL